MNQIRLSCLFLLALYATNCYAGPCSETDSAICGGGDTPALCDKTDSTVSCSCDLPGGILGDGLVAGSGCNTQGWNLRQGYTCTTPPAASDFVLSGAQVMLEVGAGDLVFANYLFATNNEPANGDANGVTIPADCACINGACDSKVYAHMAGTRIMPTGLEVTNVAFSSVCSNSAGAGCWVINVIYTTGGPTASSTIYLPEASAGVVADTTTPSGSSASTFFPTSFPVGQPAGDWNDLSTFSADYTLLASATSWIGGLTAVPAGNSHHPTIVEGFTGLTLSPGISVNTEMDAFFHQYSATIEVEETEMRSLTGQMTGTAGVEYTVDTFVGYANFKAATGSSIMDTMVSQTAIHLEKTNFFSVSTHGTNDYTFLDYINLRLVMVVNEDTDDSGTGTADIEYTSWASNFNYVQVTFTLSKDSYAPNMESGDGLIPLDSVRTKLGTFYDEGSSMDHSCVDWDGATTGAGAGKLTSIGMLAQSCGPKTTMCADVTSVTDQFVVFNVPLGVEYLADGDGDFGASDLSQNVFVSMVIDAIDTGNAMGNPNGGVDAAIQMKTTLTASIPLVEGGLNIFCDGIVAKQDLADVVTATLIIGSASDSDELARLRILADIGSVEGAKVEPSQIDTDSIEAGLMTLVVQGDADYFGNGYGIEVEDVITVHVMDPGTPGVPGSSQNVLAGLAVKLAEAQDDNTDSNGLDTDGYALNGLFNMVVDRDNNRAHLEPNAYLLGMCPFNPTSPALYSCVTRRDIRYRGFPSRTGGYSTAMEITPGETSDEEAFMVSVLGDSTYANNLGAAYAAVIHEAYPLDQLYNRAYWINPSYEWTPSQTASTSIFSLSQGIIMFALITLNEGNTQSVGIPAASLNLPSRRRVLLSDAASLASNGANGDKDTVAVVDNSAVVDAKAVFLLELGECVSGGVDSVTGQRNDPVCQYDIKKSAEFDVTVVLTDGEACMDSQALLDVLKPKLQIAVLAVSTAEVVNVQSITVDKGSVSCRRRALRNLLAGGATATVKVVAGFTSADDVELDLNALKTKNAALISSVTGESLVKENTGGKILGDKDSETASSAMCVAPGIIASVLLAASALVFM